MAVLSFPQRQDPRSRRDVAREAWEAPDAFGTTLLVLLADRFGTEALSWAPETIKTEVEADAGLVLPPANFDRLMAAVMVTTGDEFFTSLPSFVQLCRVLGGDSFDPNVVAPADATDCAWGITEGVLLNPPEGNDPFSDEICYYLGQVLRDEGFLRAPDVLRIAKGFNPPTDWADDPELAGAMFQTQEDKAREVEQTVREGVQNLVDQIRRLPLEHGSGDQLVSRLRAQRKERK